MKRGATPYDSYYDTITIDNLKAGKNVIVFLVAYNGRSGDSSVDGMLSLGDGETQGGLLFEMQVKDKLIKSDHTFKVMRLKEYKNRVLLGAEYPGYTQSSMIAERNLYYDARDSAGDYTSPDFDDSSWENATLIAKAGALPFGDLYDSGMPLMYFGDITDFANSTDYINSTITSDTTIVLDLPENMQFSAYFELEADAGKKIIYYTDTYYPGGTTAGSFKDTYVTAAGKQTYESYPWRSGQKLYIDVEAGVKFTKIAYRPSGYDSEISSSFVSSDETLNVLWQKCANTLKICMRDSFMDCPERERGPYMGDATNEMDISYYAMDLNSLALVKKAILSCVAWTGQDSLIPSRAPSSKPHEIPVQSLAFSTAVYNYWLQTGDKETVSSYYDALSSYLKVWKMKDNGMIETRAGEWNWSDWGEDVDAELLQICWYYYSTSCAKKLAEDLNKTSDISFYDERMSSIKNNFRTLYLKEDGFKSGRKADDRVNALAVLCGLVGEEDYPVVLNVLKTTYKASPYMERFVLEALCVMGEYETALKRMKDRYSEMAASGDSTVWELFGKEGGTINHGWSGGPLMIMSKYFAGIKPLEAGYSSYEIAASGSV